MIVSMFTNEAGDNGDSSPVANNNTMIASSTSITLESGAEIDRSLLNRSPLARTLAPLFRFFQSRLGGLSYFGVVDV